jgi:hypothetical protein
VLPYHGNCRLVGWDNQAAEDGIRGYVKCRVEFEDGLRRWYRLWVTTAAAGYDGILGAAWLEKEDVVLKQAEGTYQMRAAHRGVRKACLDSPEGTRVVAARPGGKPKTTWADVEAVRRKGRTITKEEVEERLPGRLKDLAEAFIPPADGYGGELPEHGPDDATITLTMMDPANWPRERVRRQTPMEHLAIREVLGQLTKRGFIRPSKSPMACALHLVTKGDGSGVRMTVDYKPLNRIVVSDRYPVPILRDKIAEVGEKKIKKYSKFDVSSAFHRRRIREGDEWKTAFITPAGLYEWLVLPFGLCTSPASFQRGIDRVLGDLLNRGVCVYLDDILVYAETDEELHRLEREVLTRLRKAQLPVDIDKSEFSVAKTKFLGLVLEAGVGTRMNPKKIAAVAEMEKPGTLTELRSALGLFGWLRPFIPRYAEMAAPLFEMEKGLSRKGDTVVWTPEAEVGWKALKEAVVSPVENGGVLASWDFEKEARVESDASKWSIGGVLRQEDDQGAWRPAGFYSRKLSPAESRYHTHDKEMLGVVSCLKEWDVELRGAPKVKVYTDHEALESFMDGSVRRNERHLRWKELLGGFHGLTLTYWPGDENGLADALSRRPQDQPLADDELLRARVTEVVPEEMVERPEKAWACVTAVVPEEMVERPEEARTAPLRPQATDNDWETAVEEDGDYRAWRKAVMDCRADWGGGKKPVGVEMGSCKVEAGRLLFNGRTWVPQSEPLRTAILEARHDGVEAGHPGREALLHSVRQRYFWPNLRKDVDAYVKGCEVCGRTRIWREKKGLLQPLELSSRPWAHMAMDYAQLPGRKYVLVMVDRFSKETELAPVGSMDVEDLVKAFVERVVARHGYPETIVTDRGAQFTSAVWKAVCREGGVDHRWSTAYHPQTDGQSERMVQEVKAGLSRYVSDPRVEATAETAWKWLPWVQLAINGRLHQSLGTSPFELLHGHRPRVVGDKADLSGVGELGPENLAKAAKAMAEALRRRRTEAAAHMSVAQEAQEEFANRRRQAAPAYRPGEWVWLALTRRRTTLGPRQAKYKVLEVVGPRSYRLDVPGRQHNVFHTDLLRPVEERRFDSQYQDDWRPGPAEVGPVDEGEEEYAVEEILADRTDDAGNRWALVKWLGYGKPTEEPWEEMEGTDAMERYAERCSARAAGEEGTV